jgi:hypothetical protein
MPRIRRREEIIDCLGLLRPAVALQGATGLGPDVFIQCSRKVLSQARDGLSYRAQATRRLSGVLLGGTLGRYAEPVEVSDEVRHSISHRHWGRQPAPPTPGRSFRVEPAYDLVGLNDLSPTSPLSRFVDQLECAAEVQIEFAGRVYRPQPEDGF